MRVNEKVSGYTDEDKQRLVSMEMTPLHLFFLLCYTCLLEIDNEAYNVFHLYRNGY